MTSLRLITGFNSVEVMTQLSRVIGETKSLVSTESEELNRALVLTIARAIHVTGTYVFSVRKPLLIEIITSKYIFYTYVMVQVLMEWQVELGLKKY